MKSNKSFIVSMLLLAAAVVCTGASAETVNVNKANASELAHSLKGVGPAKAAAIVEYRSMHGAFKSVDELAEVHGIGKATVEMNRDQIILSEPNPGMSPGTGNSRVSNVADSKPGAPETQELPESEEIRNPGASVKR